MEEGEIGFPPVARVNICRRVDERLSNWLLRLRHWPVANREGILRPAFIHGLSCEKGENRIVAGKAKKAFVFFLFHKFGRNRYLCYS